MSDDLFSVFKPRRCYYCDEKRHDVCYIRDAYEYEMKKLLVYRWICRQCISDQRDEIEDFKEDL